MLKGKSSPRLFIVNPAAGKCGSGSVSDVISSFCRSKGADFNISLTCSAGDAARFALRGLKDGFTHIVSVGGDGTASEVANALCGTSVKMAIVPLGSANDFAAACGVPSRTPDALETAFSDSVLRADMGFLDGRGFINGFGVGMDGAIARDFHKYRRFGGFAGYLAAAGAQSFAFKGFAAEMTASGSSESGRCLLAGVSNGSSQGGFKISPSARPDDGIMDFHFVHDMPVPQRIARLGSMAAGFANGGWIRRFQSADGVIEISRDLPAHMDGEPFVLKAGGHRVFIRKEALNVLSPAGCVS